MISPIIGEITLSHAYDPATAARREGILQGHTDLEMLHFYPIVKRNNNQRNKLVDTSLDKIWAILGWLYVAILGLYLKSGL